MEVVLPVQRAATRTELHLRVVATPEPATAQLLTHLGLRLPGGRRTIADVVSKITPETSKALLINIGFYELMNSG